MAKKDKKEAGLPALKKGYTTFIMHVFLSLQQSWTRTVIWMEHCNLKKLQTIPALILASVSSMCE